MRQLTGTWIGRCVEWRARWPVLQVRSRRGGVMVLSSRPFDNDGMAVQVAQRVVKAH